MGISSLKNDRQKELRLSAVFLAGSIILLYVMIQMSSTINY